MRSFLQKFAQPRARGRTRNHQRRRRAARRYFSPASPGAMLSAPLLAWLSAAFPFKTWQRLLCCGRINSFVTQRVLTATPRSCSAPRRSLPRSCSAPRWSLLRQLPTAGGPRFRTWPRAPGLPRSRPCGRPEAVAPSRGDLCLSSWAPENGADSRDLSLLPSHLLGVSSSFPWKVQVLEVE